MSTSIRAVGAVGAVLAAVSALAACSVSGTPPEDVAAVDRTVTLVTHDSWAVPEEVVQRFEDESGQRLEVLPSGDAGELTNKLVLTRDQPIGDAVFGIDNTFASRAVEEDVLDAYRPPDLPASEERFALPDPAGREVLTPVDWGDVCVNVDDVWFGEHGVAPPRTLEDLADPAYRDLLVVPAATTSSPGFAFLLATIGAYGEDGWQDYWQRLLDNGARVVSDWSQAYEVDFSAGGGGGDRPIVVSYNSSPPFTIPDGGGRPTTSALLATCFRQVEYAGVLRGTDNPDGARALIDFMTGPAFQKALPETMYVFPVDTETPLPRLWARWAEPAPHPIRVDPAQIAAQRTAWIRDWSDLTS